MDSNNLRDDKTKPKSKILSFAQDTLLTTLEYTTVGLLFYAGVDYLFETPNQITFTAGMTIGNHFAQYIRKKRKSQRYLAHVMSLPVKS